MRGGIVLGAVAALVALSGCGSSDNESDDAPAKGKADKPALRSPAQLGQFALNPVAGADPDQEAGSATVRRQGGAGGLVLYVTADLPPSKNREAYEVWVYNSRGSAKSVGAQVTDQKGEFIGEGPLPSDYRRYRYVDVSREKVDKNRAHSGISVLRGELTAP